MDKTSFMGKNLLNKIGQISFIFIYTIVIVFFFVATSLGLGPEWLIPFIVGIVIYVLAITNVVQYISQINKEKWAGSIVIEGWCDESSGVGKIIARIIESAIKLTRLSENMKERIEAFKEEYKSELEEFEGDEIYHEKSGGVVA
ncbi:MAG: hypothetical protein ACFFAS_18580 [Promethearchaeota archaeon]